MVKETRLGRLEVSRSDEQAESAIESRRVDADEFRRLLLSTRKMFRDDGRESGVRALVDRETGDRFVVEEQELDEAIRRDWG